MKIAVLGSGNGGCAVACECGLLGHEVRLFDFPEFPEQVAAVAEQGGIRAEGCLEGFGTVALAGHDIAAAVDGVDLVFAVGPAWSTRPFAEACRPHLQAGQTVVVCPSSGFGSVEFKNALGRALADEEIIVAETHTLPYGVRLTGPASLRIGTKVRDALFLAALPRSRTGQTVELVREIYPGICPAESVLQTTLQNGNPVIHPAVCLLNAGLIERTGGEFYFYSEGITPAVGRLMAAIDRERIAIGAALGLEIISEPEIGVRQGYLETATYDTGYNQSAGFCRSRAPAGLDHRYVQEDTGYGLMLLTELARLAGVATPAIDSLIAILSVISGTDFRGRKARTLDGLGLGQYSCEQLKAAL
jgi:opine dehydrogenase